MENKDKTILIIEDESSLRDPLVKTLIKEGFRAIEAKNGEEGLKIALEKHPDLILLDIIMPKMDGITVMKKIREDEWGEKAKIIILTNLSEGSKINSAMESGVYDFLVKTDWSLSDIVHKVKLELD